MKVQTSQTKFYIAKSVVRHYAHLHQDHYRKGGHDLLGGLCCLPADPAFSVRPLNQLRLRPCPNWSLYRLPSQFNGGVVDLTASALQLRSCPLSPMVLFAVPITLPALSKCNPLKFSAL